MPKALIADPFDGVRELVKEMLTAFDWEVVEACSAQEAIASAVSEQPDVIVLEYGIPEGNGCCVMSALQAEPTTRTIPVIVLSACINVDTNPRLLALRPHSILAKPCHVRDLMDHVESALMWTRGMMRPDEAGADGAVIGSLDFPDSSNGSAMNDNNGSNGRQSNGGPPKRGQWLSSLGTAGS